MKNVSILVIIGVNRETIDVTEGHEREQGRLRTVHQRHDRTRIGGGQPPAVLREGIGEATTYLLPEYLTNAADASARTT